MNYEEYQRYRQKYITNIKQISVGAAVLALLGGLFFYDYKREKEERKDFEHTGFIDKGIIGDPDAPIYDSGAGVAVGDMDNDGDLDIITATSNNIKYFKNVGTKLAPQYLDQGTIAKPDVRAYDSGVSLSLADLDNDGDLDIIVVSTSSLRYIENTINNMGK